MQKTDRVGHIALRVGDISRWTEFFHAVFGMTVVRTSGPENNPSSVWLKGGIQLMRETTGAPLDGSVHHICLIVDDVEKTRALAAPFGATGVEGKEAHWFTLPGGPLFELKTNDICL